MIPRSISMAGDLPAVVLPVEKPIRDLESKLVVASALAARGCRAIVSQVPEACFIGSKSRSLVWQGKDIISDHRPYTSNDHTADHLLRNGSAILYLHDEGGFFQAISWNEQVIGKHQVEALRSRAIANVCTWGRRQQQVIADYAPEMRARIRVTGSPRFDICTPCYDWITRDEVRSIREEHGNFILICTRFGSITSRKGLQHPFERKLDPQMWPANLDTGRVGDLWFAKWRQDLHDLAEFTILIKELATAYPDRRIVLRPHPAEDLQFYEQAFAQFKNVRVICEGNVLNWIRGADLVVHSNCTTGVEAVLAERPVMNFLPETTDRVNLDVEVAREAGVSAKSLSDALCVSESLLSGDRSGQSWSPHAASILNNVDCDAVPLLVGETLSAINDAGIGNSRVVLPPGLSGRGPGAFMRGLGISSRPKPGHFDAEKVEAVLAGCLATGVGTGRIRELTSRYVVVDPM